MLLLQDVFPVHKSTGKEPPDFILKTIIKNNISKVRTVRTPIKCVFKTSLSKVSCSHTYYVLEALTFDREMALETFWHIHRSVCKRDDKQTEKVRFKKWWGEQTRRSECYKVILKSYVLKRNVLSNGHLQVRKPHFLNPLRNSIFYKK